SSPIQTVIEPSPAIDLPSTGAPDPPSVGGRREWCQQFLRGGDGLMGPAPIRRGRGRAASLATTDLAENTMNRHDNSLRTVSPSRAVALDDLFADVGLASLRAYRRLATDWLLAAVGQVAARALLAGAAQEEANFAVWLAVGPAASKLA